MLLAAATRFLLRSHFVTRDSIAAWMMTTLRQIPRRWNAVMCWMGHQISRIPRSAENRATAKLEILIIRSVDDSGPSISARSRTSEKSTRD